MAAAPLHRFLRNHKIYFTAEGLQSIFPTVADSNDISLLWHFNRKKKKKRRREMFTAPRGTRAEGFKHLPSHFARGPNTLTVRAGGAAAEAKIVKQQIT